MPSCACGGVSVCSLHCKRERDRHLQQHLKDTPNTEEKKTRRKKHTTTTTPRFIYTSYRIRFVCGRHFDEFDRASNASVQTIE